MVGFNKTLNILIFILAGVAVTFGFFLFQKREQLRRRGDEMAKFINEVAGVLDAGSGTKVQDKLDYKNRYETDPTKPGYKKDKLAISLYHNNYNKLKTVLRPFKEQASAVITQRDQLSDTLHKVLVDLEIPNEKEFDAPLFMSTESYVDRDTQLLDIVTKLNARDNAIMAQISDSANVIGKGSIDAEALKNLEDYTTPLSSFAEMVQALKTRSDTYASNIGELCDIFGVSSPSLDGDDYVAALDTIKTEMQGQKDEFEQTKADLKSTQEELADTKERLEQEIAKLETANNQIAVLQKKLDVFLRGMDGDTDVSDIEFKLQRSLEGKILRVNEKWGFVVIDLGLNNTMLVGDSKKEVKVPLKEDEKMDVSRGSDYLGQIHIVKVAENCAIADIVPESLSGKMEPGDKVFFARENKIENQDKLEESDEGYDL
jgi:hypothetical protein